MSKKTSGVHWEGHGKKGQGQIGTETGALKLYPYAFASRFDDDRRSTNLGGVPGVDETRFQEIVLASSAADHMLGDAHANLTLLEYGDYECPACIQAEPLAQHLVEACGKRMRFVFRHFPLVEVHTHAELAAEAAEAAAAQGKFWAMHHRLFSHPHHLALPALAAHAKSIGLDMNRFNAEMADRIYTQRIQEHRRAGEHSGVRTTPAFYLNGTPVDVSFGFEKLEEAVRAALQVAPEAAAKHP